MTDVIEMLDKQIADSESAKAANRESYLSLIRQGATTGLSRTESDRLMKLLALPEFPPTQAREDAKIIRRFAELLDSAAGKTGRDVDELNQMMADHFQLLGVEDPRIAARRRHLLQIVEGRPKAGILPHDVCEFENLMSNIENIPRLLDGPYEWVPAVEIGQTAEQLKALLDLAQQMARTGKSAVYVTPIGYDYETCANKSCIISVGEIREEMGAVAVRGKLHIKLPSMSDAEWADVQEQLAKKVAKLIPPKKQMNYVGSRQEIGAGDAVMAVMDSRG